MKTFVRSGLIAAMCMGLVGCVLGNLVSYVGERAEAKKKEREHWMNIECPAFSAKGIVVTQSLGVPFPSDEGSIVAFEPAVWRVQFASEGFPQVERADSWISGTLAITERSVVLPASPDTAGVRIPYELIASVELERNANTGLPRALIIESYCGRFDVFTFFTQQLPIKRDSEMIKTAATQLKARLAAFHATTGAASKVQTR